VTLGLGGGALRGKEGGKKTCNSIGETYCRESKSKRLTKDNKIHRDHRTRPSTSASLQLSSDIETHATRTRMHAATRIGDAFLSTKSTVKNARTNNEQNN
jgi:hypothetical protein